MCVCGIVLYLLCTLQKHDWLGILTVTVFASNFCQCGQGKDLEKVMFDVLDLSKQLHGKVSIELADDMERFGRYLVNKERYSVAEALLRQSLTIKEKKRGRDHAELAGYVVLLLQRVYCTRRTDGIIIE